MSGGVKMIYDTLDFFSGGDGGKTETAGRSAELQRDWQGWAPESGMTKLGYFNELEPSRYCRCKCEKCGFYYLNSEGGLLSMKGGKFTEEGTPLCGVW